nr:MAG TPA: hypothetical protein [Caudoviricetes sp.]
MCHKKQDFTSCRTWVATNYPHCTTTNWCDTPSLVRPCKKLAM